MKQKVRMPYISAFVAIAGITAGIAANNEGSLLNSSFFALKDTAGIDLLRLGAPGVVLDIMLYLMCGVFYKRHIGSFLTAFCLWLKMYIMGYFIKAAFSALPLAVSIVLSLFTLLGGGAVSGAMLARQYECRVEPAKRMLGLSRYLLTAGIMTEGILIPTAARVLSLLFN